jgi:prophage regulatory protein
MTRDHQREQIRRFDDLPDSAYVRFPVVCALFAISIATAWRRVKEGKLPKPVKLGPRVTAFNVGSIREVQKKIKETANAASA